MPKLETRWLGRIGYNEALALQEELVQRRAAAECGDTLLLLEHDPVYTIGRTSDQSSLREAERLPYPVVQTNRGGQATYHGPGQLVAYPILDLRSHGQDLHRYLRLLERLLIETLGSYGIAATQLGGLTGVWVGPRKIASIGVGIRSWITMHGFALNTCGDLSPFARITPCGIAGVEMTSIEQESGARVSVEEAADEAARVFTRHFEAEASPPPPGVSD